jgi:hypothetical protein
MCFLFDRSKRRIERHLKSSGERLKLSERGSFLYVASLHNIRDAIPSSLKRLDYVISVRALSDKCAPQGASPEGMKGR